VSSAADAESVRRVRDGLDDARGEPPWRGRSQLDLAGLLLVLLLLVTAGRAADMQVLAITAGLGHTVAGPLHLCPSP